MRPAANAAGRRADAGCRTDAGSRTDAGLTLVETLVGVVLFTVVTGLVTGLFIDMLRTSTGTSNRLTNANELRVATDAVTKGLRTAIRPEQVNPACSSQCAEAVIEDSATSATVFANFGDTDTATGAAQTALITYRVEADPCDPGTARLVEIRASPAVPGTSTVSAPAPTTTCATGTGTRTLATGLPWDAATPPTVFSYWNASCTTAAATRAEIACIGVDLAVSGARDNPGTSAGSTVFLPNSAMGR